MKRPGPLQVSPLQIKRLSEAELEVKWNDGSTHHLTSKLLRENCPSATSRAQRGDMSHEKPISIGKSSLKIVEHSAEEQLALQRVSSVGNYAIRLHWADGHDSGIYSFEYLYELGCNQGGQI